MDYKTPDQYFFRCAFPRGRLIKNMEDELTILTQFIVSLSPALKEKFDEKIDEEYTKLRSESPKTIRNFRTEMTKLFGLTIVNEDDIVEPSTRTTTLVETQNFHLFFRSFCNRLQFPNCINKPAETKKQIENGVHFKPGAFVLRLFQLGAEKYGSTFTLSGNEVSNLVFNDSRVTTGKRSSEEVLNELLELRKQKVHFVGGSKIAQHGREFLDYLMLAKLLLPNDGGFFLNVDAKDAIEYIIGNKDFFEIPANYATSFKVRKQIQMEWALWFGEMDKLEGSKLGSMLEARRELEAEVEKTLEEPSVVPTLARPTREDLKEIGDKGELVVLKYEREKIHSMRPDKVGLVKIVSNNTELGYDIQSFEFEDLNRKKCIEVKTTERTFPPSPEVLTFFTISSNEWETARTYGASYYIYRVFLVNKETKIFIIKDPIQQENAGNLILEALKYRVIVKKGAGAYAE